MDKILFRLDFDKLIGFGHLVRCNTLASKLKNRNSENIILGNIEKNSFINFKKNFDKIINYKNKKIKNDILNIVNFYKKNKCKLLVLDKPFRDKKYNYLLKKNNIKWIEFISSIRKKSQANYVICTIPYSTKEIRDLEKKSKKDQKFYYGSKYTILRDQFYKPKTTKTKKYIFINLGGGNDRNGTVLILKNIYNYLDDFKIKLLIGNNTNYRKIKLWIKRNDNLKKIKVIKSTNKIVKHIDESKFAICSAGQISHEINSRSKKMILISIVDNQILQAKKWRHYGHSYIGKISNINNKKLLDKVKLLKKEKEKKFKLNEKKYIKIINEITK